MDIDIGGGDLWYHLRLSQMNPDIVSADSVIRGSRLVERPRLRFAIASGVGETQSREAASKRTKMSAI